MVSLIVKTFQSEKKVKTFEYFLEDQNLAALVAPNQREKVRQFIEELLSNMLNGPLDDVSVGQLFNDDKCKL